MPDTPASSSQRMAVPKRPRRSQRAHDDPDLDDRRAALAKVIPRRAAVSWWLGILLAIGFAALATPVITAERWLSRFQPGSVAEKLPAPFTVRAPLLAGYEQLRVRGGVVVARGEPVTRDQAAIADAIAGATPHGPALYLAVFTLTLVLAAIFTHHMRRSTRGRLVRVQIASLAVIAVIAAAVKLVMLSTALSPLVVPVAVLAMVPTMVLDRIVGLATGVLAALMVSLMAPFDVGLAILLLVQAATAGLVVTERPKRRWAAALGAGLVTTLCTGATYLLLTYLTTGGPPELRDPLHSTWVAAAVGPAIAAVLAVPLLPLYQLLVAEITQSKLFALEDLGHPLLREIAERAPGTWQHSLMMANMAEIAANAIGASGRLVRVGAYFHDLGKSLSPKYFIENLEPGESSPHDQLPPEVSCDAIFAHVTEGIVTARKAGLHERIVDFMHMHHGNGVLEYFWAKCREQGNPRDFTIEDFRYPGHPPQSRETAILAICDAVEAASRTLKKPDAASIDSLVQRIVYGKLHLGQLDECGLSMSDLRRISDSLRETIRHANHGRIEYPWQKAGQDASASVMSYSSTSPQLDSLDREPRRDAGARSSIPAAADSEAALAATADVKDPPVGAAPAARGATPRVESSDPRIRAGTARNAHPSSPPAGDSSDAGRAREVLAAEIREAEAREDEIRGADAAIRDPGSAPIRVPGAQTRDAAAAGGDGTAAIHARASGAEIGDGTPGIREPGSAPIRDPSSTMQDGAPIRDPAITKPGGASPSRDAGPVQAGARAAAPSREGVTTLPGRAPGPLAPPPDLITSQTFSDVPAPTARKPAMTAQPRRPETAPPQSESRNDAGEPARAAGSPAPVDFDSAITNPPPLRRGPSGHPPVPSDPAQIAVALASLASRVRAAPFGSPATTDDAAREAAQHVDLDSAITNPPPLGSLAPVTANFVDDAVIAPAIRSPGRGRGTTNPIDNAITRPLSPSPARAARTSDPAPGATTEPLLPRSPAPAPRTAELRTSGLADGERRPNPAAPPRDPTLAEDRVTVRHRASTASGPLAIRPPAPWSDEEARITAPRPAARPRGSDATRVVQSEPDAYERPDAYEGPGSHEGPEAYEGPELHEAHDRHEAHEGHDRREVYAGHDARQPRDRRGDDAHDIDAGVTEPSMPMLAVGDDRRVDLSLRAVAASAPRERPAGWSSGLASRIDARLDSEEWNQETPIVPPTEAELRALHGQPDPTRQQPIDEIERLQRRAAELSGGDPPRRSPHPTAEVDPDDIEAAIELAPPARRPTHVNAIGATKPKPKPKKSE